MSIDAIQRTTFNAVVGRLLASHREQKGLEQIDLANALNMSQPNWSRIERGDANISLELITRASSFLGLSATELVGESEDAREGLEAMGVEVMFDKSRKGSDVAIALLTGAALGFLIAQILRK